MTLGREEYLPDDGLEGGREPAREPHVLAVVEPACRLLAVVLAPVPRRARRVEARAPDAVRVLEDEPVLEPEAVLHAAELGHHSRRLVDARLRHHRGGQTGVVLAALVAIGQG